MAVTGTGSSSGDGRRSRRLRLLVFVVAYNAEHTIDSVLKRIPDSLACDYDVEILIIDDSSRDDTFAVSDRVRRERTLPFALTVLYNPVNQGYGGNQKVGFHYALRNGFDFVALIHGDGQYAPEELPRLLEPLAAGTADAVFGSRMLERGRALRGGMPVYKYVGNKILTAFQNRVLGTDLSEFHSGYRIYSCDALRRIPFHRNSNQFHFDTEIIAQLVLAGQRIVELPIPTFYGDEICHVHGIPYAFNVCMQTLIAASQRYHIFYDRKYDCASADLPSSDSLPLAPGTLASAVLACLKPRSSVLALDGSGKGLLSVLRDAGHRVDVRAADPGVAQEPLESRRYDAVLCLTDFDFVTDPERYVEDLARLTRYTPETRVIVSLGNVGFIVTRLMLLFGRFSYTRRGVLSHRHYRLFTINSVSQLFRQSGFGIERVSGVAIPFVLLFRRHWVARTLTRLNLAMIRISRSLFAYRVVFVLTPPTSLDYLLRAAHEAARCKQEQ